MEQHYKTSVHVQKQLIYFKTFYCQTLSHWNAQQKGLTFIPPFGGCI